MSETDRPEKDGKEEKRISINEAMEIKRRVEAGESMYSLAKVFGVHRKTIARWAKRSWSDLLEAKNRAENPNHISRPVIARATWGAGERPHVQRGATVPTPEGSHLQYAANGSLVRILKCPVYSVRWSCLKIKDVDVLELDGELPRGRGRIRNWDGEEIEGNLLFKISGGVVTRVEFYPDELPAKELLTQASILRKTLV